LASDADEPGSSSSKDIATSCFDCCVSGISYSTDFMGCSGSGEANLAKVVWEINHVR
jgi:hypothetical protein